MRVDKKGKDFQKQVLEKNKDFMRNSGIRRERTAISEGDRHFPFL